MWQQFFLQDFHFILNMFVALVLAAISWLYLDAWWGRHAKKELCKWTGFLVLALSFVVQATVIEQSVLGESIFGDTSDGVANIMRLLGYVLIVIGSILDPLQVVPKNKGLELDKIVTSTKKPKAKAAGFMVGGAVATQWLLPIFGFVVAGSYWRRATIGLERHLKRVAWGFGLLALADLISLASTLRDTDNPTLYDWVQAFGPIWIAEHVVLLAGAIVLGAWIWSYLTKRFFTQLFMILTVISVSVFFVVTVSFTALLLRSIRADVVSNLKTAANVLDYAIDSKQAETMAAAKQLAMSSDIVTAIGAKDHNTLASLTSTYLVDKQITSMIITDASGQVLLRAHDTEQWGDSVASDTLFRRALLGESRSSMSTVQGAVAPSMQVRSVATVKDAVGNIVGSVSAGLELDTAFVDGIRKGTGLQSSVYSGKTLAATTLATTDGKTRGIGLKMTDEKVTSQVLNRGQVYDGEFLFQNRNMIGVFLPISDIDNDAIGMLMVSQPQVNVLQVAGRSIELTFLITVLLLLVSVYPMLLVARLIVKQLD